MTFACDREIRDSLIEVVLFPEDIVRNDDGTLKYLQGSSYELRLGNEVFLSSEKKLVTLGGKTCQVAIKPGDFAILLTLEYVRIPKDLMAFISIKTTFKNMGLVNISGFHVDPGYEGKLTFSVYNAGPGEIILRYGDPLFIIFFAYLDGECEKCYEGSRKGQDHIPSGDMNKLTGKPISLFEIESRLQNIEHTTRVQWGLLAAIAVGVLIIFLKSLAG